MCRICSQALSEKIANGVSHGIGFVLAIASLPVLMAFAPAHASAINGVAACMFSATMMLLYGVSTFVLGGSACHFVAVLRYAQ